MAGLTATYVPRASGAYEIEDTGIAVDGSDNVTGVVGLTATTVNATTFDTNVAAAGVTLAGTTLQADGTDANIDITITPKGDGVIALPGPAQVDKDGNVTTANMTCTTAYIGSGGAVVYGTAPQIVIKDTDATDGDDNVTIAVSATDVGSGTEDVDITISQQIAGAPVALLTADADGTIAFDTSRTLTAGAVSGSKFTSNAAAVADSDTDAVLSTGLAAGYGLVIVRESTAGVIGVFVLANETTTELSDPSTVFSPTKDNAATYNVYYETDQVKVQNKVGDNKNLQVAWYGM